MRYDDPILETIARSIHTFFPRCMRCGEPIDSFEEADIRILTNRVVHRVSCGTLDAGGRTVVEGRGLRDALVVIPSEARDLLLDSSREGEIPDERVE